jgi:hypothetical protein
MDETYLHSQLVLLLVINLKTTAILGYAISNGNKNFNEKNAEIKAPEIKELYEKILDEGHQIPESIHTDCKPEYEKTIILEFFKKHNILPSVTKGKHQNQVAESINNQIKSLIVQCFYQKYTKNPTPSFKAFQKLCPDKFKKFSVTQRKTSSQFREFLFKSIFFNEEVNVRELIEEAITAFNLRSSTVTKTPYNRGELNKLTNIINKEHETFIGEKNTTIGNLIIERNDAGIIAAARGVKEIVEQDIDVESKIHQIQNLVIGLPDYNSNGQEQMLRALLFIASQNQNTSKKLDTIF